MNPGSVSVLALLGVLVFLATEYEEGRKQAELESDAAQLASDIRSELFRNVQTLQSLHSVAPTVNSWATPAAELLSTHREMVRLEWRGKDYALLASRYTPYLPDMASELSRDRALPDVRQACESAQRFSGPAF
jgi:two-component system, LuxR family, sensor histidine kinase DctS